MRRTLTRSRSRAVAASTTPMLRRLARLPPPSSLLRRSTSGSISPHVSPTLRHPLAIAFDIDGVILRGAQPIPGVRETLRRLFHPQGFARIPFIFLTNGGGLQESVKAAELSSLFDVTIKPEQLILGHTPFKRLAAQFSSSYVLAVGKGEPKAVMTAYGYQNVVSMEDYIMQFKDIDPLAKFKYWSTRTEDKVIHVEENVSDLKPIEAIFVVSDPVDWGRDIQVLCDVLRSGGCPGKTYGYQPPVYFAADDFQYQASFSVERLGMGAFRIALEAVYNRIAKEPLNYVSYGKPHLCVFRYAEAQLLRIAEGLELKRICNNSQQIEFENIYMIGDNPATDIFGARQAGKPWFSILTRTGCFRGKVNDDLYPADLVVNDVQEAIQFILQKHGLLM